MSRVTDCYICEKNSTGAALKAWEQVYVDDGWRLTLAFDASLPGWLVLVPRRHLEGLHELTGTEAEGLGRLLRAASAALVDVTRCVHTYVMLFAEAEGFSHLHFHIVPRHSELAPAHRGPRVFAYLGAPPEEQLHEKDRNALATELRAAMTR
jgi:diadenosine tetraphosphate (Ap4A) HIT family hydrolase